MHTMVIGEKETGEKGKNLVGNRKKSNGKKETDLHILSQGQVIDTIYTQIAN